MVSRKYPRGILLLHDSDLRSACSSIQYSCLKRQPFGARDSAVGRQLHLSSAAGGNEEALPQQPARPDNMAKLKGKGCQLLVLAAAPLQYTGLIPVEALYNGEFILPVAVNVSNADVANLFP